MHAIEVAWGQIKGTREYQQDYASVTSWPNGYQLLLLADGMGGHTSGDIASQLVVTTFKDSFIESDEPDFRRRLIAALDAANLKLYDAIQENTELSGMGTTIIAVIYDGMSIQWLSVGDSVLWLLRDGELKRLNQNHSMTAVLEQQVAAGEISSEEAATSAVRSQLLEAVMGQDIKLLDAPSSALELQKGDWLLLASDGVENCSTEEITTLVTNGTKPTADELTKQILSAVEQQQRPSQDNATLITLRLMAQQTEEPMTVEPSGSPTISNPVTDNINC
jgi:serine/threonine protein phosphatase PrpC